MSAFSNDAWVAAVETFERDGRQPGRANGPLGHIGVEIARGIRDLAVGADRVTITVQLLADRLERSKSAVDAALARLVDFDFLEKPRRGTYVPALPAKEARS